MKSFEEALALVQKEFDKAVQTYFKDEIIQQLNNLTEDHRLFFKKLYSHKDLTRSVEDVVNSMRTPCNPALKQLSIIYHQLYNTEIPSQDGSDHTDKP